MTPELLGKYTFSIKFCLQYLPASQFSFHFSDAKTYNSTEIPACIFLPVVQKKVKGNLTEICIFMEFYFSAYRILLFSPILIYVTMWKLHQVQMTKTLFSWIKDANVEQMRVPRLDYNIALAAFFSNVVLTLSLLY